MFRLAKRVAGWCAVGLAVACILSGMNRIASATEPAKPTVALVIDYDDGVEKHFRQLPWKAGMTVLDVLQAAKQHPRGIQFVYRGASDTAFLTQIDDVKNEGRGRNWIFSVNGELGQRSFAATQVKASDRVLWKFTQYK